MEREEIIIELIDEIEMNLEDVRTGFFSSMWMSGELEVLKEQPKRIKELVEVLPKG